LIQDPTKFLDPTNTAKAEKHVYSIHTHKKNQQ